MALEWLQKRGFALLERNYRVGHKEIDLIMESPSFIHIVEVKALSAPAARAATPVDPSQKVDSRKRQMLASAANYWLRSRRAEKEAQFDIVTVVFGESAPKLEYIPNAFYPIYYR